MSDKLKLKLKYKSEKEIKNEKVKATRLKLKIRTENHLNYYDNWLKTLRTCKDLIDTPYDGNDILTNQSDVIFESMKGFDIFRLIRELRIKTSTLDDLCEEEKTIYNKNVQLLVLYHQALGYLYNSGNDNFDVAIYRKLQALITIHTNRPSCYKLTSNNFVIKDMIIENFGKIKKDNTRLLGGTVFVEYKPNLYLSVPYKFYNTLNKLKDFTVSIKTIDICYETGEESTLNSTGIYKLSGAENIIHALMYALQLSQSIIEFYEYEMFGNCVSDEYYTTAKTTVTFIDEFKDNRTVYLDEFLQDYLPDLLINGSFSMVYN